VGGSGRVWQYKATSHALGLQQVKVVDRQPKTPGMFTLTVKAKEWFTAAAANQPAASTFFTLRIGTSGCFTNPVLEKVD
jgi:hypothetical protein